MGVRKRRKEEEEVVVVVGKVLFQVHVMSMLASWVRPEGMDVPKHRTTLRKGFFLVVAAVSSGLSVRFGTGLERGDSWRVWCRAVKVQKEEGMDRESGCAGRRR